MEKVKKNILTFGVIALLAICSALLITCGDSNNSSASNTLHAPALNSISVNDGYSNNKLSSVDPGMYINLQYATEFDPSVETGDTLTLIQSSFPDTGSIPLSFYLIDAAAYKNDTQAEQITGLDTNYFSVLLGSSFYNYQGGEVDLVIPEDVPTGYYRIVSFIDPNNNYNIVNSNGVKTSYMSDSFLVTNADSSWVEITSFNATSKVAVYSDSDWLRNGKPYLYDTQVIAQTILLDNTNGDTDYNANDSSTWTYATTFDTKIINRSGHIQVNFDLTLRGKIAKVTDTTYVSFYLSTWQEKGAAAGVDSATYWANLGLNQAALNWFNNSMPADYYVTPTNLWQELKVLYKGDSVTPDRFDWYFPVAAGSDSKYISDTTVEPPANILADDIDTWLVGSTIHYKYYDRGRGRTQVRNSFTLDLWIPDTTARMIDYIDSLCGKSVWRLVMYVENREAGIFEDDWSVIEQFRAEDYVRFVKIRHDDLFPDGTRAPKYAGSNWWKFNNYKAGIDRNDYTGSGGGFGCKFANYDEIYAAAGYDGGFIEEDNVQYIDVTVFGFNIPILDVKNVYKGIAYDIQKSYRQFYYKVGYWVLFSKYDELGTQEIVGLNADPFVEWSKEIAKKEKTFMVGPVPVTPAVSVSVNVGISLAKGLMKMNTARWSAGLGGINVVADAWALDGLSVQSAGSDFVAIAGKMTPYIALVAGAELAVGGGCLKAGVYCNLELLRYDMPIYLGSYAEAVVNGSIVDGDNTLELWQNSNNRYIKSGQFFRVDLKQSTLSGALGLFAEVGVPYPRFCWSCWRAWKCDICVPYPCGINWATARYELPIVSWTGLWTNAVLFNQTFGNKRYACF
ncbi:hypothetical protein KA977_05905 [Candidatus Dependentiae bacterium]|nr:hypothetical protein [Candidatus Dependentiae bacterium]